MPEDTKTITIDWRKKFGLLISKFRLENGITLQKLAELASISESYLRQIEAGSTSYPSSRLLERLVQILGHKEEILSARYSIGEPTKNISQVEEIAAIKNTMQKIIEGQARILEQLKDLAENRKKIFPSTSTQATGLEER